jgi:DNA helicase HerA-like ATPase
LVQHIAIIGKTGSGKTFAAKGIAERLLSEKQRVCVVDPTSAWWGLRSTASGDKPAFPVVVFGGAHANVPLNAASGQAIAEIIATTDTSAVLDTRDMSVGERARFFTDFAETLLRRNKRPLHLIIDEAHACCGKIERLKQGRQRRQ